VEKKRRGEEKVETGRGSKVGEAKTAVNVQERTGVG